MLTQLEKTKMQWGGQNQTIDNWLQERQDVLVSYCHLIGVQPVGQIEQSLPEERDIKRFCQLLMDYLSAGHFEIFDNIIKQCDEKGPKDKENAQAIFPKLNQSTDVALAFNDRYAECLPNDLDDDFELQLSALGRTLEQRFTYEDQLLAMLHRY